MEPGGFGKVEKVAGFDERVHHYPRLVDITGFRDEIVFHWDIGSLMSVGQIWK